MDMPNREEVMTYLKDRQMLVVSVADALAISKPLDLNVMNRKPSARDMSVFCRQFVSILNAGVSVVQTLDMLSDQTENKRLGHAISDTKMNVERGESLADAMRMNKDVFPDIFITMVGAGEQSGSLDKSFTRMAEQFEKDAKIRGMLKKATIYPAVLGIVAVGVIIIMLLFVIPTFEDMFAEMGTELPQITKIVVAASDFLAASWYIVLAVVVGAVVAIRVFAASAAGKYFFGNLARKMPLFGPLTVKTACSRMGRTLSTLLAAGISMIEAIDITSETMSNVHYKESLRKAKDEVAMGNNLSEPLQRSGMFPPLVYHMLKIGEETGGIEEMLHKLADYYEEEVESATGAIMAAMEPLIIVVMAAIVGTLVGSVLAPMASMYENLGNL
jgi:type IV pilus assembly protein PilC